MTKHTPGPWKIHPFYAEMVCDGGQNVQIANMFSGSGTLFPNRVRKRPKKEREANARLIAAAPELLKALKFLIKSAEETTKDLVAFEGANRLDYSIDCARVAIAKAEGRE